MGNPVVMYFAQLTKTGKVFWIRLDEHGLVVFRVILERPGGGSHIARLAELADSSWALLYGTQVILGDEVNLILAPAVRAAVAKLQLGALLGRAADEGGLMEPLTSEVLRDHLKRREELAGMR